MSLLFDYFATVQPHSILLVVTSPFVSTQFMSFDLSLLVNSLLYDMSNHCDYACQCRSGRCDMSIQIRSVLISTTCRVMSRHIDKSSHCMSSWVWSTTLVAPSQINQTSLFCSTSRDQSIRVTVLAQSSQVDYSCDKSSQVDAHHFDWPIQSQSTQSTTHIESCRFV
jgi:hypothetical protein